MAGITPYQVQRVSVGLPDIDGNYTVGVWVQSEDTGSDATYHEGEYNISALGSSQPLAVLLEDSGYDISDLS